MPRQSTQLFEEIDKAPSQAKVAFLREMSRGYVNPPQKRGYMPYYKGDPTLSPSTGKEVPGLEDALVRYSVEDVGLIFSDVRRFGRRIYEGITKEPLKKAYYGLLTDQDERDGSPSKIRLPGEILQPMVDLVPGNGLSLVYLLAGRWRSKFKRSILDLSGIPAQIRDPSLEVMVLMRTLIKEGIEEMVETHNLGSHRGKYAHQLPRFGMPFGERMFRFFYPATLSEEEMRDSVVASEERASPI